MFSKATPAPTLPDARLSPHAVLGASLVLLSFFACAISIAIVANGHLSAGAVIILLPVLGMAGAGLGFYALLQIQKSKGAMIGRGPATFALFAGLLSAILQGSFAAGPGRVWWDLKSKLAPQTDQFMRAIATSQFPTARSFLSESADKALTDEDLAAFFAKLSAELGDYQSADANIEMFSAIRNIGEGIQARGGTKATPQVPPKPILLNFAKKHALTFISLDEAAAQNDMIRATDLIVLLPNDQCITLFPDKDASIVAAGLGFKPVAWR